jgi:hypothetical protein
MNIFFDVDYTLLSADYHLRSGTKEVFERLLDDGHKLYIWSGEGVRQKFVDDHGLGHYISGLFHKPIFDYVNRMKQLGVTTMPDFVIDDYPEIVGIFGGLHAREFWMRHQDDDELEIVYQVICEQVATGTSTHKRWKARSMTPEMAALLDDSEV